MTIPNDLLYTEDHEWVRKIEDGSLQIGITDFAQRELDELVYIEVETVGEELAKGDIFGTVEAVKTTSELYMPVSGKVIAFNPRLDSGEGDEPTLVNEDPYGEGWIIQVQPTESCDLEELMDHEAYMALVD